MPIPITCEYCEVSYRIADKAAGKRVRCKDCGEPIDVPGGSVRPSAGRSRPSTRSRSGNRKSRSAEPREHIAGRRERKYDDGGGSKNLIIGVACAVIAVVGGSLFLLFGRGDDKDDWVNPQAAQGVPGSMTREQHEADLAAARRQSRELADQISKEGQEIARNANPDNWQSPTSPPPVSGMPSYGGPPNIGPPPGFGMPPDFPGTRTRRGPGSSNGGRSGSVPGFSGSTFPRNAETDDDFNRLEEALSGSMSERSRAVSVLGRSRKKDRAAAVLAKGLTGNNDTLIFLALGRLGTAGETQVLNIMRASPDDDTLRACLSALMQCGTSKCLTVVSPLKDHSDRHLGAMARGVESKVRILGR